MKPWFTSNSIRPTITAPRQPAVSNHGLRRRRRGTRVFQFRLDPVGFCQRRARNTNVVGIEFINGTTTVAVAPIPTNGPDAIVSNAWYHVAVTYNGSANTTSNLLFYWTLLDSNPHQRRLHLRHQHDLRVFPEPARRRRFSASATARAIPAAGTGPTRPIFSEKLTRCASAAWRVRRGKCFLFPPGIAITTQPSPTNQLVGTGQSISYSVTATGSPLNYQWQHNGSPLSERHQQHVHHRLRAAVGFRQLSMFWSPTIFTRSRAWWSSVTVTNLVIITQPVSVAAGYAGTATFNVVRGRRAAALLSMV